MKSFLENDQWWLNQIEHTGTETFKLRNQTYIFFYENKRKSLKFIKINKAYLCVSLFFVFFVQ